MTKVLLFIALALTLPLFAAAQRKDSLIVKDSSGNITIGNKPDTSRPVKADSVTKRKHSPRQAAIRSAILPGLGQIYNRKYWKVPIVYAAIGIPIYTFFDNRRWYNRTRYALTVLSNGPNDPDYADNLAKVHSQLQYFVENSKEPSLLNYRNEFRKNMDYSILFTLLFWGLNVVDATVDAHLKGFNVNENLSMQVKPAILSTQSIGVSVVFKFADKHSK